MPRKLPIAVPPKRHPLSGHDRRSLGAWLNEQTACGVAKGERAATRMFRHAFRGDVEGDARWDEASLHEAKIGRWARPAALLLSPAPTLEIVEEAHSEDGTVRLLLGAHDGGQIESVLIPTVVNRVTPRTTLCVSSQVGCARACTFCETGSHGLTRQLDAAEIVDQYRIAARVVRRLDGALAPISNMVFMGMGEPFDNLTTVVRAIEQLCEPYSFAFAPSRITVSTVGVAEKIAPFFASTRAELAISLNAPDDERRSRIMPINERTNLAALREALLAAMPKGRHVLFQYALFEDFNDSVDDAAMIARYVDGIRCSVNVIPANPGPDPSLRTPSAARVDRFVEALHGHGVTTLVRRPRGRDVGGACGQLAGARRRAAAGEAS